MDNELYKLSLLLDRTPLTTLERQEAKSILERASETINSQRLAIEKLNEKVNKDEQRASN